MKTVSYNPSPLEVELATFLQNSKEYLENGLNVASIEQITTRLEEDNPLVIIRTRDLEDDVHELVIRIIQRPDDQVKSQVS